MHIHTYIHTYTAGNRIVSYDIPTYIHIYLNISCLIVCMMYACMYIFIHACMHTCKYIYIYLFSQLCKLHTYIHTCLSFSCLIGRMYVSVCMYIYVPDCRWLLQGELSDPHHEFFIGAVTNPSAVQNVWRDTYFLRPAMLPIFLPIEVATKILLIGKTSNFLKICLPKLSKLTTSSTGASGSKARLERGVALTSTPQTSSGSPTKVRSPAPSYRAIGRSKKLTTGARVKEEDTLTEDIVNPSQGSLSGENKHVCYHIKYAY